jgi:hypothetical protein
MRLDHAMRWLEGGPPFASFLILIDRPDASSET